MEIRSPAFEPDERIPPRYTADGRDFSPPLEWSDVPEDATEFAIVCEDPDAPGSEPWVHWLAYCIPGIRTSIGEATSGGGFEGENSWGQPGYRGPSPPAGTGPHHYHFRVYALDDTLSLGLGSTKQELFEAMDGHILDQAELVGVYQR